MVTDCRRRRLLSLLPLLLTNGGHIIINDITYDMNKLWYTWYDMRDSDLWLMKIGERSLAENKSIPISIVTKLSTSDIDKFTHKFGMSIKWMVINGFHWLETLFMNSWIHCPLQTCTCTHTARMWITTFYLCHSCLLGCLAKLKYRYHFSFSITIQSTAEDPFVFTRFSISHCDYKCEYNRHRHMHVILWNGLMLITWRSRV